MSVKRKDLIASSNLLLGPDYSRCVQITASTAALNQYNNIFRILCPGYFVIKDTNCGNHNATVNIVMADHPCKLINLQKTYTWSDTNYSYTTTYDQCGMYAVHNFIEGQTMTSIVPGTKTYVRFCPYLEGCTGTASDHKFYVYFIPDKSVPSHIKTYFRKICSSSLQPVAAQLDLFRTAFVNGATAISSALSGDWRDNYNASNNPIVNYDFENYIGKWQPFKTTKLYSKTWYFGGLRNTINNNFTVMNDVDNKRYYYDAFYISSDFKWIMYLEENVTFSDLTKCTSLIYLDCISNTSTDSGLISFHNMAIVYETHNISRYVPVLSDMPTYTNTYQIYNPGSDSQTTSLHTAIANEI